MTHILIIGNRASLALPLGLYHLRLAPDNRVTWIMDGSEEMSESECRSVTSQNSGYFAIPTESTDERFKTIALSKLVDDTSTTLNVHASELWILESQWNFKHLPFPMERRCLQSLLGLLPALKIKTLNYVDDGCARKDNVSKTGEFSEEAIELRRYCTLHGLGFRRFEISLTISDWCFMRSTAPNDVLHVLTSLHDVITEIQERFPSYFESQELRWAAPAGATIDLVRLEDAVTLMHQVASSTTPIGQTYRIASGSPISLTEFGRVLGEVYQMNIKVVCDGQQLNAIDQIFQERIADVNRLSEDGKESRDCDGSETGGRVSPLRRIDHNALVKLIRTIRNRQLNDHTRRSERSDSIASSFQKRNIKRTGDTLSYFIAGEGKDNPTLILLNALGQGLQYWYRLITELMNRYRVIIWELRGLTNDSGNVCLDEQVDDLAAVMREEKITSCYLVGWCSGPQVAVEYYLRHSKHVLGMFFLNATFKVIARPELETPYERDLENLCQTVDRLPTMAEWITKTLLSNASPKEKNTARMGRDEIAVHVLSLPNSRLRSHVLAPFRTVRTTLNYARQVVDLLSQPTLDKAKLVSVPVFVLGSEYDQVASAAKTRAIAKEFPKSWSVVLRGASHYVLYDRPTEIAALIDNWCRHWSPRHHRLQSGRQ